MAWLAAFEEPARRVRDEAITSVRTDKGVRVEDFLAVLASATGEAAIATSAAYDIERNEFVPGAAVFSEAINQVLTGGSTTVAEAGMVSVVGILRDRLVPGVATLADFGALDARFESVAAHVGELPWGQVYVDVPVEHRPWVLPLQAAYAARPVVTDLTQACESAFGSRRRGFTARKASRPPGWGPHVICALALASAIELTKDALDVRTGLGLSLDIVFGTAKMVPMSKADMASDDARDENPGK